LGFGGLPVKKNLKKNAKSVQTVKERWGRRWGHCSEGIIIDPDH